jgi:hypothetical protein
MILEFLKMAHAKVQGDSHKFDGTPCQDATFTLVKNNIFSIAVADGAGSRTHSQYGAEVVVKEICNYISDNFHGIIQKIEQYGKKEEEIKRAKKEVNGQIISHLQNKLTKLAQEKEMEYNQLSSTLMFASRYDDIILIGHIGDGVIGGMFSSDEPSMVRVLSEPDNGELENITYFVTDHDAASHLRITLIKDPQLKGIVLMSDGPQSFFYRFNQLTPSTSKLFAAYNGRSMKDYNLYLERLLEKRVSEKSTDDLSLAIMYNEVIETEKYSGYFKNLLSSITSSLQIIKTGFNSVKINPYKTFKTTDLKNVDQVEAYINDLFN